MAAVQRLPDFSLSHVKMKQIAKIMTVKQVNANHLGPPVL